MYWPLLAFAQMIVNKQADQIFTIPFHDPVVGAGPYCAMMTFEAFCFRFAYSDKEFECPVSKRLRTLDNGTY